MSNQIVYQNYLKPLYEDIIWNKPENKNNAGKILIIGGSQDNFRNVSDIYNYCLKARAGTIKIVLPNTLQKNLFDPNLDQIFLASTKSGSFSSIGLAEMLDLANWSDITILAGNFSKSSETELLMQNFLNKCPSAICIVDDALEIATPVSNDLNEKKNRLLIGSFSQLQKALLKIYPEQILKVSRSIVEQLTSIEQIKNKLNLSIISYDLSNFIVISENKISLTKYPNLTNWKNMLAAFGSTYFIHNQETLFKGLTSAVADGLNVN
jgi:NAD(P)H-hydrate repair Nnr-like enzyme with NAD(P)H-hydrate dehydratase domain